MAVLGYERFFMSEVPLYQETRPSKTPCFKCGPFLVSEVHVPLCSGCIQKRLLSVLMMGAGKGAHFVFPVFLQI